MNDQHLSDIWVTFGEGADDSSCISERPTRSPRLAGHKKCHKPALSELLELFAREGRLQIALGRSLRKLMSELPCYFDRNGETFGVNVPVAPGMLQLGGSACHEVERAYHFANAHARSKSLGPRLGQPRRNPMPASHPNFASLLSIAVVITVWWPAGPAD
jgi:hypothetical protein